MRYDDWKAAPYAEDHYGTCGVCREAEADAIGHEGELCEECAADHADELRLAAGVACCDLMVSHEAGDDAPNSRDAAE
jgi:hypothetical protein